MMTHKLFWVAISGTIQQHNLLIPSLPYRFLR